MIRLNHIEQAGWPKLAWVAVVEPGSETVSVRHGPCVECAPAWCAEGVWDGDFAAGDFDLSDVVVGTGIRARGDRVLFVSSSDTLNRLHHFVAADRIVVANSLAALLALADLALLPSFDYASAMESIKLGLDRYVREIPVAGGVVPLTYFDNLVVENGRLRRQPKPERAPDFPEFAAYRDYLFATAKRIGENAAAPERRHAVTAVATVSSGYDSVAAAVLAREAGARVAVTIDKGRRTPAQLFRVGDSGEAAAAELGIPCRVYPRARANYPHEDALWAGTGNAGDINLTVFEYPQPVCLLFTGFAGDVLWDRDAAPAESPLRRKDTSGTRFCESRLELGVLNCSPVFWGCRKERQIAALSRRPEMRPWTLGTDYDRPIPRRLAEEAGVSRRSFGTQKRLSSFARRYGRPLSADLRRDFATFLAGYGGRRVSAVGEWLSLLLRGIDGVVLRHLAGGRRPRLGEWISLPAPSMFFVWANERQKRRYGGLSGRTGEAPAAPRRPG
jgi:hypothetical protein